MSLHELRANLTESTDRIALALFGVYVDNPIDLLFDLYDKMIDLTVLHQDHIDRAMIDQVIAQLHALNSIEASIVAESLDRWYYNDLVEFRIRST